MQVSLGFCFVRQFFLPLAIDLVCPVCEISSDDKDNCPKALINAVRLLQAFNDYFTHRVGPGLDLRNDTAPDFSNRNESNVYMTEVSI